MYRVIIDTKYGNHIEFEVDNIDDPRVQEILRQEWITSCDIRSIKKEETGAKKLQFASTKNRK